MKGLIVVAVCIAFACVVTALPEEEDEYSGEFDNIDVQEVFNSARLYKNYIVCFKTGEKCTPAGKKIRERLPEGLRNECKKCTQTQREKGEEVLRWIVKNKPDDFLDLETIYDPDHVYRVKYAERLQKEGITLPPLK